MSEMVLYQGAIQQFQLPCVCQEGLLSFRRRSPAVLPAAFNSVHSSEVRTGQPKCSHTTLLRLHALHTPSTLSSKTSGNPEQILLYEHFQHRVIMGCAHPAHSLQGSIWRGTLEAPLKKGYIKATHVCSLHVLTRKR